MNLRTANPALRGDPFQSVAPAAPGTAAMTLGGVIWKTAVLLLLMVAAGVFGWRIEHWVKWLAGGTVATSVVGWVTRNHKNYALAASPLYAAGKGLVLGLSASQIEAVKPGFAFPALCLTLGCALTMLLVYRLRILKASQNFATIVATATGGAGVLYAVVPLLRHCGIAVEYPHVQSWLSQAFSLYVVVSASSNLVLDFDVIEKGIEQRAPRMMEWYAGFSLLVTLVWLYVEAPRLLTKLFRK